MQDAIRIAIEQALVTLDFPEVEFVVDYPTDKNAEADFFSNVALVLSKQVGKNPREIAEQIMAALGDIDQVESVEVAGPGFLNFSVHRKWFTGKLTEVHAAGETWGHNSLLTGKRIMVEYTQPNPLKVFHIGHLMSNAIGESLSRLVEMSGAETFRANYQGDVGLHIGKAMYGMQQLGYDGTDISKVGEAYAYGNTKYEENPEAKSEIISLTKSVYAEDPEVMSLYTTAREVSLQHFADIYARVGSKFDRLFFESETWKKGKEVVEAHLGEVFEESDGAVVYRGEADGLHTRVFINSQGVTTYEAKDVGLAFLKRDEWEFDECIYVTAVEQDQYFKVVFKAIEKVDPWFSGRLTNVAHGMMQLPEGKMSSRTGNVVTGESMLDEAFAAAKEKMQENNKIDDDAVADAVGIGALKYMILHQALNKNSVYDLTRALSFEGDSGPYLQYTYARIQSVLQKAAQAGVASNTDKTPAAAYAVEKLVERFPSVIETALTERAPHHVVTYLMELAGEFNSFYATEKIADASDEYAPYKAAVAEAVALTLRQGLWALGIEAPERM